MSNWKFNKDGWTDWITHDGKGCPLPDGTYVSVKRANGVYAEFAVGMHSVAYEAPSWYREAKKKAGRSTWIWISSKPQYVDVAEYRVRKPKGLTMLEELLEKLPETV